MAKMETTAERREGIPLMEIRGGDKKFGRLHVFRSVEFTLAGGEIVALLGLNGSGKTTMLRTLAGLSGLDRGEVRIAGKPLDRFSMEQRRRFHFVPDFPVFFEDFPPLVNLGIWLRSYGREDEESERRAMGLLEKFGLLAKAKLPVASLSRGQRFKLALTALVAIDPEVWLLDEPFASGMDPEGLSSFRQEARSAAARGRAVLYSTQMAELAVGFSDRVCVLHDQALYFDGTGESMTEQERGGDLVLRRFLPGQTP